MPRPAIHNRNQPPVERLNDRVIATLANCMRHGLHFETACRFIGISPALREKWLREGRRDCIMGDNHTMPAKLYRTLERATAEHETADWKALQAVAHGIPAHLEQAVDAATGTPKVDAEGKPVMVMVPAIPPVWQALTWCLERRYPKRFGSKGRDNDETADTGELPLQQARTAMEQLAHILAEEIPDREVLARIARRMQVLLPPPQEMAA